MEIRRIDGYTDSRFSPSVLNQHGAYLLDGEPYQIEIMAPGRAVVRGKEPARYPALIEAFRFHAPHITAFFDENGGRIVSYPEPEILDLPMDRIQPSQFFIDEDKLKAVRTFVRRPEDIVIQVIPDGDRYISLDGHTRLYLAVLSHFCRIKAVQSETDEWIWTFVQEAERRGIRSPADMILLPHEQYERQWNQYCDRVFAGGQKS